MEQSMRIYRAGEQAVENRCAYHIVDHFRSSLS